MRRFKNKATLYPERISKLWISRVSCALHFYCAASKQQQHARVCVKEISTLGGILKAPTYIRHVSGSLPCWDVWLPGRTDGPVSTRQWSKLQTSCDTTGGSLTFLRERSRAAPRARLGASHHKHQTRPYLIKRWKQNCGWRKERWSEKAQEKDAKAR